jgi:hypothetical protein
MSDREHLPRQVPESTPLPPSIEKSFKNQRVLQALAANRES